MVSSFLYPSCFRTNMFFIGFSSVGPSSMPCLLMVGFYTYAKSLEINVDKEELEGTSVILMDSE